jgi:hypothetical protein
MSRQQQVLQFQAPVAPVGLSESSVVSSTISCKPHPEHIADGTLWYKLTGFLRCSRISMQLTILIYILKKLIYVIYTGIVCYISKFFR